ncbi:hypothetical protein KA025_02620 [Candidatus Saccharibacteria bacterium]|nr:hypothetical protein [Candidatus Saccharibacteria bacterium]MBP7834958.1 hypothetical protein [Candidatus Saccharibacteria bacterium]
MLGTTLRLERKPTIETLTTIWKTEYGAPATGLSGIDNADDVLQHHGEIGLLIGGVAKALWDRRQFSIDSLKKHKDVDVITLGQIEDDSQKFNKVQRSKIRYAEGGIDWWGYLSNSSLDEGDPLMNLSGNVRLCFTPKIHAAGRRLEPGLYIPTWGILRKIHEIEYKDDFVKGEPYSFLQSPTITTAEIDVLPFKKHS